MDAETIERHIAAGESSTVELKKSTASLGDAMKAVCGMLNADGGLVVFGVSPSGKLVGQRASDETLREVAAAIRKIEPFADVDCRTLELSGGESVLVLTVPSGPAKPYTYDGRPWVKVASTKSPMPQAEYQRRLLARDVAADRWELRPAERLGVKDLDADLIRGLLEDARAAGRLTSRPRSVRDSLSRLDLLTEDGSPRRAAVVLFARKPTPYYPQCAVRLARFRGVTRDEFLDSRQTEGPAFALLEEAMQFLLRHLPVSGRIVPGVLKRQDTPLFPPDALREALVNAFCHRDYSIGGGAVSVGIYDDRVEIDSSGLLPVGMTIERLLGEHTSQPPNRTIAGVFHLGGLIERWGRGVEKIITLSRQAGHPDPEFLEIANAVRVRFRVAGYTPPTGVNVPLSDRQRHLLQGLADGLRHSREELAQRLPEELQAAERQVRSDLVRLRDAGLVVSGGRGANAWWSLSMTGDS